MTIELKPGVYDLSIEKYHSGPGISRSQLMDFKRSPLHFWDNHVNPDKPKRESHDVIEVRHPLEFGNAVHTYILENREFERRYVMKPDLDLRTKADKDTFKTLQMGLNGREFISQDAINTLEGIKKSIERHEYAYGLITDALYEHSLYWLDKDTQILCKVRPDIWHENMVCDLKTTNDAEPRAFARSVFSYGYHIQAAMIHEALYNLYGQNMTKFIFIAVEKNRPFAVGIHELDEYALARGVEEFKDLLYRLKDCMDRDIWPGYERSTIGLPAYY